MVTENIRIDAVTVHVKKDNVSTYKKLNGKLFIWDDNLALELERRIGKTMRLEIDREGNFPKVKEVISEVTEPGIEVVNLSGQAKPVQTYNVDNSKICNELAKEFILKQDKPNSRTFGSGRDSVKIYFSTADNLKTQIQALLDKGLMPEDYKVEVLLTGENQLMTDEEQIEFNNKALDKINPSRLD